MPMTDQEFQRRRSRLFDSQKATSLYADHLAGVHVPQMEYRGQCKVGDMDKGPCGGWLAPDGRFWPCTNLQHQAKVDEIVVELGLRVTGDPMAWLEKRGWFHVMDRGGFAQDTVDHYQRPTQAQMDVLWDLANRFPEMRDRMLLYFDMDKG